MPYNYNINWHRFAVWGLQIDLRKPKWVRYIISLIEGVKMAYYEFIDFRAEQLYEASLNGQVCKLERVLNDKFDPLERRIYISDGEYYEAPTFYEEYKNQPVIFREEGNPDNPVFWSTDALGNRVSVNFIVHVPTEVFFEKDRVRALVSKYKIFGRTFEIVII